MPIVFGFATHRRGMLEAELARLVEQLPALGALRAVLVGDLASGRCRPDSELELVLVQETAEPFQRRAEFWVNHLRPRVGTRFLVYTPDEVEALGELDPLLREAEARGKLLIG
jgi:hypothetical protein